MDTTDRLRVVLSTLSDLVDRLWHGQLELQVVGGGTVHQALDRMMVMGATYADWLRGDDVAASEPPAVYGWVPAAEFREVMDELAAAASAAGSDAHVLRTPLGRMAAGDLIRTVLFGAVLNGRSLAAATGLTFPLPAEILAAVDPFAPAPADTHA